MNVYASPEDIDGLSKDVIACRVAKGKVPLGCTGLSLAGGVTNRCFPGTRGKEPDNGKLWWVRQAPFHLSFAPLSAAPEAGLQLTLQVATGHDIRQGLVRDEIAWYLDSRASPCLTRGDIERELTGHALLQPPPAMQAEEAEAMRRDLSAALLQGMGLECVSLQRADLFPVINCALVDTPSATTAPDPTAFPASARPGVGDGTALPAVIELDARYQARLFRELPRLAQRLREQPWPEARVAFTAQVTLLQRLEHLAATTNRLPTLESRINPKTLPEDTVRLLAAECRRASEGLDSAWAALEIPDIARLDTIVSGIETAIARRRTPWWQIT